MGLVLVARTILIRGVQVIMSSTSSKSLKPTVYVWNFKDRAQLTRITMPSPPRSAAVLRRLLGSTTLQQARQDHRQLGSRIGNRYIVTMPAPRLPGQRKCANQLRDLHFSFAKWTARASLLQTATTSIASRALAPKTPVENVNMGSLVFLVMPMRSVLPTAQMRHPAPVFIEANVPRVTANQICVVPANQDTTIACQQTNLVIHYAYPTRPCRKQHVKTLRKRLGATSRLRSRMDPYRDGQIVRT